VPVLAGPAFDGALVLARGFRKGLRSAGQRWHHVPVHVPLVRL